MKFAFPFAAIALTIGASAQTHAQQLRDEKTITLALAAEAASAAVAACQAKGIGVGATVVDPGGVIRVVHRGDGAGPHTLDGSLRKAYTAASYRANSGAIAERAQKDPGLANLGHINGLLLLAGGVPIRAGKDVVGAIGVSGSPAGTTDEECANAGIAKISDRLK